MIRHHHFMLSTVGVAMLATAAVAQTSAPTPPSSAPAAPTAIQTTASTAAETNLAGKGKWRASKLIGVDIYGPDDKKVGDVTEVIVDKTGKAEMVTIGVGGFLGIGSKDVAVPYASDPHPRCPRHPSSRCRGSRRHRSRHRLRRPLRPAAPAARAAAWPPRRRLQRPGGRRPCIRTTARSR